MSIQQNIQSDLYRMADMARTPQQIQSLQQHISNSVRNGAVEAYVGVPLLQQLNGRLKQAQMMARGPYAQQGQGQGQEQPAIADQIMQEAQQEEQPGGVDQLPSNLYGYEPEGQQEQDQEEGYAGGGIIAFADEGQVRDPRGSWDRNGSIGDAIDALKNAGLSAWEAAKLDIANTNKIDQERAEERAKLDKIDPQTAADRAAVKRELGKAGAAAKDIFNLGISGPGTLIDYASRGLRAVGVPPEIARRVPDEYTWTRRPELFPNMAALDREAALPDQQQAQDVENGASQQSAAGVPTDYDVNGQEGTGQGVAALPGAKPSGAPPSTGIAGVRGAQGVPAGVRPSAPVAQPGQAQPTAGQAAVQPGMSMLDRYTAMLEKQGDETKKERESAKWTALLMGGLGVAGGTSPNALANLSAGALPALQQYEQTMSSLRKEDAQRLEKLMAAGVSKEKFILEARKLDISDKRADQMFTLGQERNNILLASANARGAGSGDKISAAEDRQMRLLAFNANKELNRVESEVAKMRNSEEYRRATFTLSAPFDAKNASPTMKDMRAKAQATVDAVHEEGQRRLNDARSTAEFYNKEAGFNMAPASGAPVAVTSKEQRDKLPKGTKYIGTDGKTYTKGD